MLEITINSISIEGEYVFEFRDAQEMYKVLYGNKMMTMYYPTTGEIARGREIKCKDAFVLIEKRLSEITCLFRAKDLGDKRPEFVINEPYECDPIGALKVVKLLHEIRTMERPARSRMKRGPGRIPAMERLATETIEEGVDRRMQKNERNWRKRMDALCTPLSEMKPEEKEHFACRDLFDEIRKDKEMSERFDLYRKMRPLLASKDRADDAKKKIIEIFDVEEIQTFDRLIGHTVACPMRHVQGYFVIGECIEHLDYVLPETMDEYDKKVERDRLSNQIKVNDLKEMNQQIPPEKLDDLPLNDDRYTVFTTLVNRMRSGEITQEEAKIFLEEQNFSMAEVKACVERFEQTNKGASND